MKISLLKSDADKVHLLAQYGVLAPSTHNTQPWKLKIHVNTLEVYADFSKQVPHADPVGRDFYISLGALVKNIELAAQAFNVKTEVDIKDLSNKKLQVATLRFDFSKATDTQYNFLKVAIAHRQNYRGFFNPQIDFKKLEQTLNGLSTDATSLRIISKTETITKLGELTAKGLRMGYAIPEFRHEISSLINHNLSRKRHGLHGYSLRMNLMHSIIVPKIMKRKDIGPKLAMMNLKTFASTPAVAILSSKDNEAAWFEAGRILEGTLVRLAEKGFGASIFAAAIETPDLRRQLIKLCGVKPPLKPQLLVCIGNPTDKLSYSHRKSVRAILV